MKSEVPGILFIVQNLLLNKIFAVPVSKSSYSLSERSTMSNPDSYSLLDKMKDEDFKGAFKQAQLKTYIQQFLKNPRRGERDSFVGLSVKRNLLYFTNEESSSSASELSFGKEHNDNISIFRTLVPNTPLTSEIDISQKKMFTSPYKTFHHIFSGVINFNKSNSFNNETNADKIEKNFSNNFSAVIQDNSVLIPLNNQSSDDWYTSLIIVINTQDLLNTSNKHDIKSSSILLKLNSTLNEMIDILKENFDCIIEETFGLNISCVDVDFDSIGEYLPNETVILDLSYGNQMKLLKPLFPYLKSLRSLILTHNHHRYITRAFMGLDNLEKLDLSDNDIMVISNALSYVPRLRSLNLSRNQFRRIRTISNAVKSLENLENLTLNDNVYIKRIEEEDLYNLKKCNISLFSLFNTTLQYIEKGSFNSMPNLRILELSVNYLNEQALANVSCSITENIEILYFGHMLRIKEFPIDAINCLSHVNVRELYLWYNYFSTIPILPNLPYLQILSLSNCSIKDIAENAFENIPSIEFLFLRGNKLRYIPSNISSLKNLKELYIESQNSETDETFFIQDNVFHNATSLEKLILSLVRIELLYRYNLYGLSNLKYLFLSQTYLFTIEDYVFETLTSLEFLDLRGNGLKVFTNFTFYGLKNLKYLYLVGNFINFFESVYPFQYCPSLYIVLLQYNNIEFIPEGMFLTHEHLKMLILGRNKIVPWTKRMLHPKASVIMLGLAQNNIDYVSEIMLKEFNQVTKYLDLGKNPFNCSKCGMKKFQEFCLASNLALKLPTPQANDNTYHCVNPEALHDKNLFEIELPEVVCNDVETHIINIMAIILACFFMLFIIGLTLVCYIFRWYIRYWIFHVKTNFKRKTSSFGEKNYMYDAFIIYSSCDTAWVVNYLIPALENHEPPYKLCVHQRDFQVGRQITENILEAVENSRKVILILTEGFIKSEWCMYELHLAQHKLFGDTRDILILVKLNAIDKILYSKNLLYIEKTRRCFTWNDSNIGQKLFWNQIRKQLGKPGPRENFQIVSKC